MPDERIGGRRELLKLRRADAILPTKLKDRSNRCALEQRLGMLRLANRDCRAG